MNKTITVTLSTADLARILLALLMVSMGLRPSKKCRLDWMTARLRIERQINEQLPESERQR